MSGFEQYFSEARRQHLGAPRPVHPNGHADCSTSLAYRTKVHELIFRPLGTRPQQQALHRAKYQLTELFHRMRRHPTTAEEHLDCLLPTYLEAYDRLDEQLLTHYPPSVEEPAPVKATEQPSTPAPGRVLFGVVERAE